jgi:hypothetical protein
MTLTEMQTTPLEVADAASRALSAWEEAGRKAQEKMDRKAKR